MIEIIKKIFDNWGPKKILGFLLVILGLLLHLVPLFPASGIVVVGLELLGIRILLQDKIKIWYKNHFKK